MYIIKYSNVIMNYYVHLRDCMALWDHRTQQRRSLKLLDARLLDDMGLSTAAAEEEAGKPFWRA
jgi:uncharacterized protein YjiS (DUF1127 family)